MSTRHPIDAIFKDKLAHHSSEPPMHLWDKIEQKRAKRDRSALYFRSAIVALALLLFTVGLRTWIHLQAPSSETAIQSLPIPLKGNKQETRTIAQIPSTPSSETSAQVMDTQGQKKVFLNPKGSITLQEEKPTLIPHTSLQKQTALTEGIAPSETETTIKLTTTNKWRSPELMRLALMLPQTADASAFQFTDPTDCAKFKKRPWKYFATFGAAIDLTRRQLTPKDSDAKTYTDTRENTELPFYSFSMDARVSMISPIGLGFTTGLDYTQINEKFDFIDPQAERTEVITNEYGPNGEILGTDTVLIFGTREIITYNRYRILDIPLLIGYELDFTHFSLGMKGGLLLNILSRQKGDFLSPVDMQPVSFTSDEPNAVQAFKRHLGIGYYGGLSFNYKMNAGLQISFEPFFRVYPKSFTKESFEVSQKYFLTGLKLGLKIPLH